MAYRRLNGTVSLGRIPRWLAILLIFGASRIVSSGILLWFAAGQAHNAWTAAHPDLFEFSRIWDSHWNRIVAESGYPTTLPVDNHGRIAENAWAFLPLYPMLVRAVMSVTGVPFSIVSVILSTLAFGGFLFTADRLFRRAIGDGPALAAISIIAFAPTAPIFQVGYSESWGMLFLALILVAVSERRWWWAGILIPFAALTRPIGVPLAFMAAFVLVHEWKNGRDRAAHVWLTVVAGLSAIAWPVIAWLVTGRMTAYLETELAWRRPYLGNKGHGWGTGWWDAAVWWFKDGAPWVMGGVALLVIVIAALPTTRALGRTMLAWVASYVLYLVLVFFPQSSTFRILMPLFPLAGTFAKKRGVTVAAIIAGVIGQYFWVRWCWAVDDYDWTPP